MTTNSRHSARDHIFISYRRDDARGASGRLYDWLRIGFGREHVFRDVHSLGVGKWRDKIDAALARSAVCVAVIGPRWANVNTLRDIARAASSCGKKVDNDPNLGVCLTPGLAPNDRFGGYMFAKSAASVLLFTAASMLSVDASAQGAATSVHAGPVTQVAVVRGAACAPACDRSILTNDTAEFPSIATNVRPYQDVQDAFVTMRIDKPTLFVARFASDSSCNTQWRLQAAAQAVGGHCAVRILVAPEGGQFVEMDPTTTIFEQFQIDGGSGAHVIERSYIALNPGLYTVKVQFSIPFGFDPNDAAEAPFSVGPSVFTLTAWHLTLQGAQLKVI